MFPRAVHMDHFVTPPRAYVAGGTGPAGQVLATLVSPVAQVVNLELVVNPHVPDLSTSNSTGVTQKGVTGNFVEIFADGADLYIIVGASIARVQSPSPTGYGTLTASGTYNGVTGACWKVPNGTSIKFVPQYQQDKYMGVIASATGAMRMAQVNPSSGGGM